MPPLRKAALVMAYASVVAFWVGLIFYIAREAQVIAVHYYGANR